MAALNENKLACNWDEKTCNVFFKGTDPKNNPNPFPQPKSTMRPKQAFLLQRGYVKTHLF